MRRSKFSALLAGTGLAIFSLLFGAGAGEADSADTVGFKKRQSGLYMDVFNDNIYHEFTSYLHLERFYRKLTGGRVRSANVNAYDEVPDSTFFINRHARSRMSLKELEAGYHETEGPDLSGDLSIVSGKFEGMHPGFFVQDVRGDKYLLKFDSVDSFELRTSAEVIASRFLHAIGYNVPQYTVALIEPRKFLPAPDAKMVDDTGFRKRLTTERLEQYLLFLPQDEQGRYRASASKILPGENKGPFSFHGRRKNDPEDPVNHRDRREIRALRVFASWLNNYDVRESNTLDTLVEENGRPVLKHYWIDFNASLGGGAEYPMFTHEHMLDYGEALKAFSALGLREKPWQRRWREAGQQIRLPAAVGYFDNRHFDPGDYKTQLPYYAFKDMTRADAFWAAKIIMSFTDDEIKALVKPGKLSSPEEEAYVAKVLIERRDLIGRYWFDRANPLDQFDLQGGKLLFRDLAVDYRFYPAEGVAYKVEVFGSNRSGKRGKKIGTTEIAGPSLDLSEWLGEFETLTLALRTLRPGSKPSPYVFVKVNSQEILEILHED